MPNYAKVWMRIRYLFFFFFFGDLSWKEFGELVSDLKNGLCVVILDKYLSFLTLVLMDEISTMTDRSEVDWSPLNKLVPFANILGLLLIQNVNFSFGQSTDPSVNDSFLYSVQHTTVETWRWQICLYDPSFLSVGVIKKYGLIHAYFLKGDEEPVPTEKCWGMWLGL